MDTNNQPPPASDPPAPPRRRRERSERRVAINSGLLLLAQGLQAAVSLILVGLIARYLGQAGLGRYGFVISFIELFIAFVDLGMNRILVREIARRLDRAESYTSAVWTMRLLLSLITLVIVGAIAAGGDQTLWTATMVYFLAQALFLLADVFNSVFHGFQRMEYQLVGIALSQVLMLALTVAVIWMDLGLVALFGARVVANGAKLAYSAWISERRFARAHFLWGVLPGTWAGLRALPAVLSTWRRQGRSDATALLQSSGEWLGQRWQDTRLAWHMLVESLPVGVSLILRNGIWRGGVVLTVLWLGQEQGDLVNGLLYGPLRVVQQMRIVPAAFSAALLPVFSNRAASRPEEFDTAFAKSLKLFTAISLLISLAITFLADPIVNLLLGGDVDLAGAALVMVVLGWVTVLYFPNWLYGVTLVALGRQKLETLGLALGLVAGVAVAWWAIPRYEALGAVYAILSAEGVFFLVGTAAMRHHFHWRQLLPSLSKVVLACLAAGVTFAAGHALWAQLPADSFGLGATLNSLLELVIVGGAGMLVFAAALGILKAFDEDELEGIKAMLPFRRGGA